MLLESQHDRRQFLAQLVRFLFLVGLLAFIGVILSSLTSTSQNEVKGNQPSTKIDLSQLKAGQLKKVSLRHKEVWIYHRTNQDIETLKQQRLPLRSQRDEYFVFFPYEPKRQCLVNRDDTNNTFYDTCNARHFDVAGRLIGQQAQQAIELPVPKYHFISEQLIQVDAL